VVIVGWVLFAWAAYKVAQIKTDHVEYDPYEVLGIDRVRSLLYTQTCGYLLNH